MKFAAVILLLSGVFLVGCRTARNVAVTSFRVVDTPARYLRERIDSPTHGPAYADTVASSDTVMYPGRPVEPQRNPAPQVQRRTTVAAPQRQTEVAPRSTPRRSAATTNPSPAPSQRTTSSNATAQFPTAKPVPGKPGYVFSPFDPSGGYVDVNGFSSGQKVKDPYSQKIFLVP